jgi:hypothetical protein
MDRTIALLTERRGILEQTAQRLLEKGTLDEAELLQLTKAGLSVAEIDRGKRDDGRLVGTQTMLNEKPRRTRPRDVTQRTCRLVHSSHDEASMRAQAA